MDKITEKYNPESANLDFLSIKEILLLINQQDSLIHKSVYEKIPKIEKLIKEVVNTFEKGGSLIYVGCGTSGRIAVLDAAECYPTFSVDPKMVRGFIAGGKEAMVRSIENAEDSIDDAVELVRDKITKKDIVVGISANGEANYVLTALKESKKINAKTCMITCNNINKLDFVDYLIPIIVGPEIIAGSTRMKAGTATKMVLNMITTTAMIKINKTYRNIMVDLKVTNKKLKNRAIKIISDITRLDDENSELYLNKANGEVKKAIIMYMLNVNAIKADNYIKKYNGNLKKILSLVK